MVHVLPFVMESVMFSLFQYMRGKKTLIQVSLL